MNNFTTDLVSVIIPTYKRPTTLPRALQSILNQTYTNIEIIVVDDNNDGDEFRKETELMMKKYENESRIHYVKHSHNMNGSAARNTGITYAKGDFLVFLDDDDIYNKHKIERAITFLKGPGIKYGGAYSNYVKKYNSYIYKVSNLPNSIDSCYELLAGKYDYGSSYIIRRKFVEIVKGFNPIYKRHQDWEFLIRLLRVCSIGILPEHDLIINADAMRVNISTVTLLNMKTLLLKEFEEDINTLGDNAKNEIYNHQWVEMTSKYLKNREYKNAYSFARKNLNKRLLSLSDYMTFILSTISGIFPQIMIGIYFIFNIKLKERIRLIMKDW